MTDPTFAPALTPEQMELTDDELRRQGLPVPTPRDRERFAQQQHRRQRAAQQQAELAKDADQPSVRWVDPKAPEPHALPTWARRELERQSPPVELTHQQVMAATEDPSLLMGKELHPSVVTLRNAEVASLEISPATAALLLAGEYPPADPRSSPAEGRPAGAVHESPAPTGPTDPPPQRGRRRKEQS